MKGSAQNFGYVIFLSVVASLGGFLFGYDTAVISGTIDFVSTQFHLDAIQQGWYVGCALIGSILGVAIGGVISDSLGRKRSMILSAVLFSISGIGCAFSLSVGQLVLYRILGGLGIGMVSIISPMYISEISLPAYRGRMVSLYQLSITIGFLGAYLVNYELLNVSGMHLFTKGGLLSLIFVKEVWRGMLGMESLPAILFFAIIFFIPESPRWLIVRKHEQRALVILSKVYKNKNQGALQLQEVKEQLSSEEKSDWRLLFQPAYFKALIIGVCIAILGQFMGVNAVLYYGPTIFTSNGLSNGDSLFYQVLVGLVNMLTTILALVIIDKVGRKKLVYYGVSGMIICLLFIAFYFKWGHLLHISNVALLILFLGYIFCTAISISAVIWVLLSEMYPTSVRGIAMAIAGFSLWVGTYLIGQLTPWMLQHLMPSGTFLLFAFMCIPYMLIVWKLVPETAGKSLEEIERLWLKK